jgi:hypothetical protein
MDMMDPNNMTFEQFKGVMAYQFQGIDPLCDKYYWNLWQDSRRYGCKNTAAKPVWEDFLEAIRTGKI